jgi:TolB-like protein/Tfp pilus assembly protein PilF
VLPFDNLSKDPSQEYFSHGMTESLIMALSKQSALFVTDRRSAFTYKEKEVDLQQISQELGVQYVVAGGVQKGAERVRLHVQLIDMTTGEAVWSDQYDQELSQIFALQQEIQAKIMSGLKISLSQQERDQLYVPPTDHIEAYEAFLQGFAHHQHSTQEDNIKAQELFARAIELDPTYAVAHARLSETYLREWSLRWGAFTPETLEHAFALAQKAVSLDESLAVAHDVLSQIYTFKGQPEQTSAEVSQAIALNANTAHLYVSWAQALNRAGKPQEAIAQLEKARRLDPHHTPHAVDYLFHLGSAYRLMQQYEEAIAAHKQVLLRDPEYLTAQIELAIIYHELGQPEDAQAAEEAVRQLNPNFPLEELRRQRASLQNQQEEKRSSVIKKVQVSAHLMSGFAHFVRSTPQSNRVAHQEFAKAAALDPQFAMPHAAQALAYMTDWNNQ